MVRSKASAPQLSEYERLREENIRRNDEFLKSLGLADIKCQMIPTKKRQTREEEDVNGSESRPRKIKDKSKVKSKGEDEKLVPSRRSSRAQGIPVPRIAGPKRLASPTRARSRGAGTEIDVSISVDDEEQPRKKVQASLLRKEIDKDKSITSVEGGGGLDVQVSNEAIQHTLMRIGSMSNARLATRIKVIARASGQHCKEKLLAFYHALRLTGLDELAESCKATLEALGHKVKVQPK